MPWDRLDQYCIRLRVHTAGAASVATPTISVAYSEARQAVSYVLLAGSEVLAARPCIATDNTAARREAVAELQTLGEQWHAESMARQNATRRTGS
jgi:DNA-binding LacI/PurR family transcriptional regulator